METKRRKYKKYDGHSNPPIFYIKSIKDIKKEFEGKDIEEKIEIWKKEAKERNKCIEKYFINNTEKKKIRLKKAKKRNRKENN